MNIQLIKATDADITFLLALRKLTMTQHLEKAGVFLSESQHISRIKKHFDSSFIIELDEEKIGLLKYIDTSKSIEILQFQVLPKHQKKGIGKYVLTYMIQFSRSLNKELTLNVLKENPARFLYERNGFVIVGEDQLEYHMLYRHIQ